MNPMSISLEQLLPMMMGNMEALSTAREQDLQSNNAFFRVLYNKGIITEEDLYESFKKEFELFKSIGKLNDIPSHDETLELVKNALLWIKLDKDEIEKTIEEHKAKLEELARKQNSKIDVVSGDVLNALNNKDPKKLIL